MSSFVRVLLVALCLGLSSEVRAADSRSADGLWIYQTAYPTGLAGRLLIGRDRSGAWTGTIGNRRVSARADGASIILAFPQHGGTFRGTFANGSLRGFWARRAITEDPLFPLGRSLSYAAPLEIRKRGSQHWIADVRPLADTFTLYLKLYRDGQGQLLAAFRNPELNSFGPAMLMRASVEGSEIRITSEKGEAILARLMSRPQRLSLIWPDLKRRIALRRATAGESSAFYPATAKPALYGYRIPANLGDGWQVARARDVGIDEAALSRAVQRVIDRDPASDRPWLIHSLAVAYKGKLVLDEYFYGHDASTPHDTRSAGKTFSSVILGALMLRGSGLSPETKVYDAMAPLGPFANADERKRKITLGHLLTHSAGLACDDNTANSPGNEDMIEADRGKTDWAKVTLDLPIQFEPGAHYAYCSMNINLAGAVLRQNSREWLPALFDRTVARPLRFGPYYWNLQPNGEGYLGGGAFVRPRDFLKVGQAYLDGGMWNGRRLVSAAWVKDSLSPHMRISPQTTGLQGDAFRENYWEVDEGWAWHMIPVKSAGKTYQAFHANGNGGQLLIIVPELNLAVMFTAGNYGQGLWNRERDEFVSGMIIPAIVAIPAHAPRDTSQRSQRDGQPSTMPETNKL